MRVERIHGAVTGDKGDPVTRPVALDIGLGESLGLEENGFTAPGVGLGRRGQMDRTPN